MKLSLNPIAAAILVPVLCMTTPAPASARDRSFVDCASEGRRQQFCPADTRGGVRLARQFSKAPCEEGRSWGHDRNGVWVTEGCRGRFELGRGGGRASRVHTVTCESHGGASAFCAADTRGGVWLEERLSSAACDEGHGWGYDRRGIWVDNGCRARFRVGDGDEPRYSAGSSDSRDDGLSSRDIATAAAVIGGVALLGAILGGDDGGFAAPPVASESMPPPTPSATGTTVPSWAVGQFRGFNPQAAANVELNIYQSGDVIGYVNGQRVDGYYSDQRINMSGYWFDVIPDGGGFRTVMEGSANQVVYRRVQ